MKRLELFALAAATAALGLGGALIAGEPLEMTNYTVDCGGGTSTGGSFVLTGTIAQPEDGAMLGAGDFAFAGGFYAGGGDACTEDIDGNGDIDFADIFEIILFWGPCGDPCPQDLSGNGDVDFADIFEVILNWGPCPV